jgi:hypothetical protein
MNISKKAITASKAISSAVWKNIEISKNSKSIENNKQKIVK